VLSLDSKGQQAGPVWLRPLIVDVEATPARTYDQVAATKTMVKRTDKRMGLKPNFRSNSISIRSMLAVVPGGEQFYTDASWPFSLDPSGREAPRSAKEEDSHEGLVSHRSAVRSRDLRNDPDLSASNAAWSRTERRWGEGHHLRARPSSSTAGGKT